MTYCFPFFGDSGVVPAHVERPRSFQQSKPMPSCPKAGTHHPFGPHIKSILTSRLIMGIIGVTIWVLGVINLLTKSP